MPVSIYQVAPGSLAERAGIRPGDRLIAINKNLISDVLDYRFYLTEERVALSLATPAGEEYERMIRKGQYDDIGLEFETYLMDRQHACRNKCLFCFIDQMPAGMRQSLYFKDDDERLSFLFGNYITLTNLSRQDVERIVKLRISPINVSVHTTNPQLRVKMMGNRFAGQVLEYLEVLARGGIRLNTQIVACPGLNDGEELRRTVTDLLALGESLESIAVVPVGLTRYREGLYPLRPFTPEEAAATIDLIDQLAKEDPVPREGRAVFCSDEFYLLAGRPLPGPAYYGDYPQLENGVGALTLLEEEFGSALALCEEKQSARRVAVATGRAAEGLLRRLAERAMGQIPGLQVAVYPIDNEFFGEHVTVAGLITGRDLMAQLKGKDLGEGLYVSCSMLRHEQDRFLDDVTVKEVSDALGVPVHLVENDGFAVLDAWLGL